MAAVAVAVLAATCAAGYAAQAATPEPQPAAPDTVPPVFDAVPGCLIEALAAAGGTTVECKTPTVTGATRVDVERPATMDSGDSHTLAWKDGSKTTHTEILASVQAGTHTARWIAADAAGNVATATQVIVVQDTRPPKLTLAHGNRFAIEATEANTALAESKGAGVPVPSGGEASPPVTITTTPATLPVPEEPEFETVTWRAEDAAGNVSTVSTRVLVRDTADPVITAPARVTIQEAKPADITRDLAGVSVEDSVDPNPVLIVKPDSLPVGSKAATVTWTATDASGNDATATQEVTVTDFKVASAEFRNNGIEITFSKPVNPETTAGILVGKWGQVHAGSIGAGGLTSTVTATGSTVRIAPTLSSSDTTGFCGETAASASCVGGLLAGTWVVSLPGKIASSGGNPLYAAPGDAHPLYDGGKPRLESCLEWGDARPGVRTRGVADLQGCVGYDNTPGQGSPLTKWARTHAPVSAPANAAPVLSASIPAGTDRVSLDWKPGSAPSTAYTVEKSVGGGAFAPAAVTAVNATKAIYTVTETDLGSDLSFRVTETTGGVTTSSNAHTISIPTKPAKPLNFNAAYGSSGQHIILTWDHSPIASGYRVVQVFFPFTQVLVTTLTENTYAVLLDPDRLNTSNAYYVESHIGSVTSGWEYIISLSRGSG